MAGNSTDMNNAARDATVPLTEAQARVLASNGWDARVGGGLAVWVSVKDQRCRIIKGRNIVWEAPCSSAANGVGSEMDSLKTPLGWHSVAEKIGEGVLWGQVFRGKQASREIWRPGQPVTEDLILTRILALTGEEPGKNKGGNVDSFARYIYIHGTNDEENIGKPRSHGCIRLTNDAVIAAYDKIPLGALVLITE